MKNFFVKMHSRYDMDTIPENKQIQATLHIMAYDKKMAASCPLSCNYLTDALKMTFTMKKTHKGHTR